MLGLGLEGKKLAFVFNSVTSFGTTSVKFYPETRSAIVAFSSSLDAGDAAEFANLLLTQDLFCLRPHKDIITWVDGEVIEAWKLFQSAKRQVEVRRTIIRPDCLGDYVGVYSGFGINLVIELTKDGNGLELLFNGNQSLAFPFEPHSKHCFSFWPPDRDAWLARVWLDLCH